MLEVPSSSQDRLFATPRYNNMPVDFAAYLLSSSPPGFEMYNASLMRNQLLPKSASCPVTRAPRPIITRNCFSDTQISIKETSSQENVSDCSTESTPPGSPTSPTSPTSLKTFPTPITPPRKSMGKKKVSFADDLGLALTKVKILTESPDTPPRLRKEILESLTQGASASVTEEPPLVLKFTQPASDYLAFREKIEKNFVSLENVILKDYNVMGTIKVKNIAFEKSVKIRVTYDNWENHFDVVAIYVPTTYNCGTPNAYDTFSFELSIPTDLDIKSRVQFAVCYDASGRQFWDNNEGNNYEIVSKEWKNQDEERETSPLSSRHPPIFTLGFNPDWTRYSSWSHANNETPYW